MKKEKGEVLGELRLVSVTYVCVGLDLADDAVNTTEFLELSPASALVISTREQVPKNKRACLVKNIALTKFLRHTKALNGDYLRKLISTYDS